MAICKDWHGIWLAFAGYALLMAMLFVPLFKHRHVSGKRKTCIPSPSSAPERAISAMPNSAQIVVVGSYVQDQAWFVERIPRPGETPARRRSTPGPAARVSIRRGQCAARRASAFIGAIGKDTSGDFAQGFAAKEKLPCRWQIRDDQPTATSSITVDASGQNQIAMIFGANEHLDPAFVRAQEDLFAQASTLLVQLENNLDAIAAALELAQRHGLTRVLNPHR